MFGWDYSGFWWLFPLVMCILCFFMMRGKKGSMMCGFGSADADDQHTGNSASAQEILDKRYPRGEINGEEYIEKKQILSRKSNLSLPE